MGTVVGCTSLVCREKNNLTLLPNQLITHGTKGGLRRGILTSAPCPKNYTSLQDCARIVSFPLQVEMSAMPFCSHSRFRAGIASIDGKAWLGLNSCEHELKPVAHESPTLNSCSPLKTTHEYTGHRSLTDESESN